MTYLSLIFVVGSLSPAETQELPWSQDVAATREAALRDRSPCVILLNSDAKASSPKAWKDLTLRLQELKSFRRLAELCEARAEKPEWEGKKSAAWLLRALEYRLWTCFVLDSQGPGKVRDLAARILSTHPDT